MSLFTEINENAALIKRVVIEYGFDTVKELCESMLDEVSAAAMGRAAEKEFVQDIATRKGEKPVSDTQQEIIRKLGAAGKTRTQQAVQPEVNQIIKKDGNLYVIKSVSANRVNLINMETKDSANEKISDLQSQYTPEKDSTSGKVIWKFNK